MPELHPSEIVSILTKRISNLRNGSGDYSPSNRVLAIRLSREALEDAQRELQRGN